MTKEEKRDRREARHELARQCRRQAMHRLGLYSTAGQIKAAIRVLVDRQIASEVNSKPLQEGAAQ